MARVAILNDLQTFAQTIADGLGQEGHQVLTEVAPINFERIVGFVPQVIVVWLASTREPPPGESPEAALEGYEALVGLEVHPALASVPVILLGSGLAESDVPTRLSYDWFLDLPADLERLSGKVRDLAGKARTRHKLSHYFCPQCHARLVCVYSPHDLFCLRCGTAVTIEGEECDALTASGLQVPCSLDHLKPPKHHS